MNQIQEKKNEASVKIAEIVAEFEQTTNTTIKDIELRRINGYEAKPILVEAKITLQPIGIIKELAATETMTQSTQTTIHVTEELSVTRNNMGDRFSYSIAFDSLEELDKEKLADVISTILKDDTRGTILSPAKTVSVSWLRPK